MQNGYVIQAVPQVPCTVKLSDRLRQSLILVTICAGLIVGCGLGCALRSLKLDEDVIELFLFPGEILLRMLQMILLPVITCGLFSTITKLDKKQLKKIGLLTLCYYLLTTMAALSIGVAVVTIIQPGDEATRRSMHSLRKGYPSLKQENKLTTKDLILDLCRNVFVENIFNALHRTSRTFYYNQTVLKKLSNDAQSLALAKLHTEYAHNGLLSFRQQDTVSSDVDENIQFVQGVQLQKKLVFVDETNLLGFVVFILVLASVSPSSEGENSSVVKLILELDAAFQKITCLVLCYSPIGLGFIASGRIMEARDFSDTLALLTKYLLCLCLGFFLYMVLIFVVYAVTTRKNPMHVLMSVAEAWMIALTAASRTAVLPVTLKIIEDKLKVDRRVSAPVLAFGSILNLDGAALYEVVAAIFIIQVNRNALGVGDLITIIFVSIIANIGSASAKSRGFFTLVSILNAIGHPTDDVIVVLMFDWFFNRLRTSLNVLSDAYGATIIHHYCGGHIPTLPKTDQKSTNMGEAGNEKKDSQGSTVRSSENDLKNTTNVPVVKFLPVTLPIQNGGAATLNSRGTLRYVNGTWCCASPHAIN